MHKLLVIIPKGVVTIHVRVVAIRERIVTIHRAVYLSSKTW